MCIKYLLRYTTKNILYVDMYFLLLKIKSRKSAIANNIFVTQEIL